LFAFVLLGELFVAIAPLQGVQEDKLLEFGKLEHGNGYKYFLIVRSMWYLVVKGIFLAGQKYLNRPFWDSFSNLLLNNQNLVKVS
jgi:hypothetical protein